MRRIRLLNLPATQAIQGSMRRMEPDKKTVEG